MDKPSVGIVFIYALTITLLAFIYRSGPPLVIVALINGLTGFTIGLKKHRFIAVLFLITVWALIINAYFVANTGEPVYVFGSIVVREGMVEAVINISGRLLAIAGAALILVSLYTPLEIIKGLESELKLPKIISFPLAYGLRLLPIMQRDYNEIRYARKQRGYRTIPITPNDIASYLQILVSLAIERAIWTGIAIELRGFHHRKTRYRGLRLKKIDYALITILIIQSTLFLIY
ncbi:MAG: cobalt transporter [Desulfurococcales archaeon ex4484_58]|nr:MAG: cobalt transporter [Desulfurococcales archaeon ex4484_58]